MKRRQFLKRSVLAGAIAAGATLPACRRILGTSQQATLDISVFLGAKEFEPGTNRLPFVLVLTNNEALEGASGTVELHGPGIAGSKVPFVTRQFVNPVNQTSADEVPHVFETRRFYDCNLELPGPGFWQVSVEAHANGRTYNGNSALEVKQRRIPGVRDRPESIKTPTEHDGMGIANLCTREPPCGMHARSLDESMGSGKPLVLVVATPKFCTSRLCGPVLDEALGAKSRGSEDVIFIHQEVYQDEQATQYVQLMQTWQLDTEPFVFVMDGDGVIRSRFEGPVTQGQIEEALSSI